ncbi:ABC transporter protein [Rutstroemia sp. NJR-2017a WRK4]|nr:ABC transporter protein [Rutstroemia sp. NJR-2017a WRK4]
MDRSGYARIGDPPPALLSRVHTGYPREKHQKVECAPAQVDQCIQITPLRDSYDYQRYEVPSVTNLGLTQTSEASVEYKNPFLDLYPDSPLNPRSINFSPDEWATNLHGFMAQDPMRYPRRSAGFCFENLSVHSFSRPTDYQKDVANVVLELGAFFRWLVGSGSRKVEILKSFDGFVEQGETLLIIGRPGAGSSTLLKTISGDIDGLVIDPNSIINYHGVSHKEMHSRFRGEMIRFAEMDTHFASLTVGETLLFAARARAPCDYTFPAVTRDVYAEQMKDVVMTTLGLCHLEKLPVGKITSAGEKRRVSIAEAALGGHQLQCWDNSTRGLENIDVLRFCKMVQLSTAFGKSTACVALHQTPETVYKMFDKVTLLYEGRQIYFGPCDEAKSFFTDLGFICEERQTTADFLMSLTNPDERLIK